MAGRGGRGDDTRAEERRYKAFELRKAGNSYRFIAQYLKDKGEAPKGYNGSMSFKDVKRVLDDMKPDEDEVESYRRIQIARLEEYLARLYTTIVNSNGRDLQALDRALKIEQRLSMLKGTDQEDSSKRDLVLNVNFNGKVEASSSHAVPKVKYGRM
jgi:hypothetical protein